MGKEKNYTLLLAHLGLFGESQCADNQKAQVGTKDRGLCVFLAMPSIALAIDF